MTPRTRKKRRLKPGPQRMTTDALFELFESRKQLITTALNDSFDDGFNDDFDDEFRNHKYVFGVSVRDSTSTSYRMDIADSILNNKPLPFLRCESTRDANEKISTDTYVENATQKDKIDEYPSSNLQESDTTCDKATQTTFVKRTAVIVRRDDDIEVLHRSSTFSCQDNTLFAAGYRPQRLRSAGSAAPVKWVKERESTEVTMLPGNKKILLGLRVTSSPIHNKIPLNEGQRNDLKTRRLYDKLSRYLSLVYDYPKAFRKLQFLAASNSDMEPCLRRVMQMGRAFGGQFGRRESPALLAAYELGSRRRVDSRVASTQSKEANQSTSQSVAKKTHKLTVKVKKPRDRSRSPDCDSREPFEKNLLAQHGAVVAGLWKAREDAEKVLTTVTTSDGMRARDWVLRELGEDEGSVQQWWVSQKQCRYLRRQCSSADDHDGHKTKN